MTLLSFLLLFTCVSYGIHSQGSNNDQRRWHEDEEDFNRGNDAYRKDFSDRYNVNREDFDEVNKEVIGVESFVHSEHQDGGPHLNEGKIQMPDVSPHKMDTYLCVAHELPKKDGYIVGYEPIANMQIAHHMLLFGCEKPFKKKGYWKCRDNPECIGKQTLVYAWAKNAPPLKMPEDVGFHVGGSSGYKYLVLQVHYLHVSMFQGRKTDNSGVKFILDEQRKRYLAGIYEILDQEDTVIPPHRPKTYVDAGCYYEDGPVFYPFRFRTHAHKLGLVLTGYRVRNNKWTLIGRGDPQKAQAFYKVANQMDVKPGDSLMGRCTYNTMSRDTNTYIGATHSDEMCNFYIMYYYDSYNATSGTVKSCEDPDPKYFHAFPKSADVPLSTSEETHLATDDFGKGLP